MKHTRRLYKDSQTSNIYVAWNHLCTIPIVAIQQGFEVSYAHTILIVTKPSWRCLTQWLYADEEFNWFDRFVYLSITYEDMNLNNLINHIYWKCVCVFKLGCFEDWEGLDPDEYAILPMADPDESAITRMVDRDEFWNIEDGWSKRILK